MITIRKRYQTSSCWGLQARIRRHILGGLANARSNEWRVQHGGDEVQVRRTPGTTGINRDA
jgi:hypothetical protein